MWRNLKLNAYDPNHRTCKSKNSQDKYSLIFQKNPSI